MAHESFSSVCGSAERGLREQEGAQLFRHFSSLKRTIVSSAILTRKTRFHEQHVLDNRAACQQYITSVAVSHDGRIFVAES